VLILSSKGFITLDVEYIDGTKIESKANKYTFVWRKSVEKNRDKLMKKISALLDQVEDVIAQDNTVEKNEKVEFTPSMLIDIISELKESLETPPAPTDKEEKKKCRERKRQIKQLEEHLDKLREYDNHLTAMGELIPIPRLIPTPLSCV